MKRPYLQWITHHYLMPLTKEFGASALWEGPHIEDRLLGLVTLLIPFFAGLYVFLSPMPVSSLTDIFFYHALGGLLVLLIFRKLSFTLRFPASLPFLLFFIWAAVGLFWTLDVRNTFHDLRAHFLEYLIIFYILVNFFNSPGKLQGLSRLLIACVVTLSAGAIIEYYFIDGYPFTDRLAITFKHTHTNYVAFMNVTILPLALNALLASRTFKSRLILALCIALMVLTILLTQSRAALISLFAGVVILCLNNKKILYVVVPVVVAALLLPGIHNRLQQQEFTDDVRSKINRLTLEIIKDHPVTGIGFGMQIYGNKSRIDLNQYNKRLPEVYQQQDIRNSPHNSILDVTVRTGIVGLILYTSILLTFFWMLWKTYWQSQDPLLKSLSIALSASLVSSLIASLFEDVTFGAPAVIQYTILAMITILWKVERHD